MADVEKLRKVKQCIDSLAEGLNPFTGQPLPEADIVNDVRVSRSLFLVSAFLQEQMQGTTAKKPGKKQAFRLSLEERERVEFSSQPIPASGPADERCCRYAGLQEDQLPPDHRLAGESRDAQAGGKYGGYSAPPSHR